MIDVLSRLGLASGIPFGLLLTVLVLAGLGLAGLLGAVRQRRRAPRVAFILLALVAWGRLALGLASEVVVDTNLNPVVRPEDLVGTWTDGHQVLLLREDESFELTGQTARRGRWTVDGWNLEGVGMPLRVIEVNGVYRIVQSSPDDPDLWDGHLGFAREASH